MNDLELLDKYCEESLVYVHPLLLNDVSARGLTHVVDRLPNDVKEAKAVVRCRLAKLGKCFGDPEIDYIASQINRLEFLRNQLAMTNLADPHKVLPLLNEMKELSEFVLFYYK